MAAGATEGAYQIAGNDLLNLSEQQLVDCDINEQTTGCDGGQLYSGFYYYMN